MVQLLLPQSAVLSDENGNYVYVINPNNTVERRPVKIGSVNESGVERSVSGLVQVSVWHSREVQETRVK